MQKILSLTRRAAADFNMIAAGDRIAAGVSGGKDSLLTLWALAELRRFYPAPFEVEAITLDMGNGLDFSGVGRFCEALGVPYTIVPTKIFEIVFETRKETHPCSLCAKMRRGALHEAAVKRGCRKVALGHHLDDAVETFMLSLFFEGRVSCFQPVTYLDRKDITLLRPLIYTEEWQVRKAAKKLNLPIVANPCPANGHTKRQEVKDLLKTLEKSYPGLRHKIFGAMKRHPLQGWETAL
ncbi:MAG: tRNA 2-thiocytidine biosynthesis TtcA family protein [Oscillospiraceae bacterium]|nr:tRNA 2-thiocytidine biosynthesis TtcA family protein [Oscillospiraceae bacterium]